jgi:hypothetical protein
MTLTDKRGRVTAYGLACGYVETKDGYGRTARLWREHGAYHVRATVTATRARVFWESFATLADARKRYAGALKAEAA